MRGADCHLQATRAALVRTETIKIRMRRRSLLGCPQPPSAGPAAATACPLRAEGAKEEGEAILAAARCPEAQTQEELSAALLRGP